MSTSVRAVTTFNESGGRVNRQLLSRIGRSVLEREGVDRYDVTIVIVDNIEIARLNKQYLDHPGPTDVIAFEYDEPVSGDLFVSRDQAALQALEYGVTLNNELARLVIHGILHLTGMRDDTPARRGAMRRRENSHLRGVAEMTTVRNWMKN